MFEVFYCVNIIPVKLSISLALVRIAEVRLVCIAQLVVQMLTNDLEQNRRAFIYVQYGVMAIFTIMNLVAGQCYLFSVRRRQSLFAAYGSS